IAGWRLICRDSAAVRAALPGDSHHRRLIDELRCWIRGQFFGRKTDGQEPTDAVVSDRRSSHAAGEIRRNEWQPAATASGATRPACTARPPDFSTNPALA